MHGAGQSSVLQLHVCRLATARPPSEHLALRYSHSYKPARLSVWHHSTRSMQLWAVACPPASCWPVG